MQKIILTIIALMLLSSVGYGEDWKHYGTGESGDWFYDTQSISQGEETVKVWIKTKLSDKEKTKMIQAFPKTKGIEDISFITHKEEINCSKNEGRTIAMAWYDSKGNTVIRQNFPDSPFTDVFPESVYAALAAKIICKEGEGGK